MEINNYWVVGLPIDTDINIDMLSAVEKFKRATYIRENPKRFLNELNEDFVDTKNMKYYYLKIEDIIDEISDNGLIPKQKAISIKLESLVGRRFSKKTLEQELSKIFKEEIHIQLGYEDVDNFPDYNYMFYSENEEYGGDFDVYVLKQRHKDDMGNNLYVTEVGYDFTTIMPTEHTEFSRMII